MMSPGCEVQMIPSYLSLVWATPPTLVAAGAMAGEDAGDSEGIVRLDGAADDDMN